MGRAKGAAGSPGIPLNPPPAPPVGTSHTTHGTYFLCKLFLSSLQGAFACTQLHLKGILDVCLTLIYAASKESDVIKY